MIKDSGNQIYLFIYYLKKKVWILLVFNKLSYIFRSNPSFIQNTCLMELGKDLWEHLKDEGKYELLFYMHIKKIELYNYLLLAILKWCILTLSNAECIIYVFNRFPFRVNVFTWRICNHVLKETHFANGNVLPYCLKFFSMEAKNLLPQEQILSFKSCLQWEGKWTFLS